MSFLSGERSLNKLDSIRLHFKTLSKPLSNSLKESNLIKDFRECISLTDLSPWKRISLIGLLLRPWLADP
jgi:hypothetical protein